MRKKLYGFATILVSSLTFVFGLYTGTVNNNYIHQKKLIFKNIKILTSNYIKSFFIENDKIEIKFSKKQLAVLKQQQQQYINKRVLIKDSVTWIKPEIKISGKKYKGKLKLKGLFLDKHERYENLFSYSIKVKDTTFKNMSGFYLHYPEKRHNLFEWYGDNILKKTGLIYHKNDFAELFLNKTNYGPYLVEEHTNKKFIIRNNRPLGPIIYFSKKGIRHDRYYESTIEHPKTSKEHFINAEIVAKYPHKMNARAKELMNDYLSGKIPPEKAFNIQKTASIFAISEMVGYIHQLQYHNVKFYYNPIEDKLEPIANDFEFHQLSNWTNELITLDLFKKQNNYIVMHWSENLFKSQKFLNVVFEKLRVFASEKFINTFFQEIKKEEDDARQFMSKLNPFYVPDIKFILSKNVKHINYILLSHKNLHVSIADSTKFFYSTKCCIPIKPISISSTNRTYFTFPDSLYLNIKPFLARPVNDSLLIKMPSQLDRELVFNYKLLGDTTTYRYEIKSRK